MHGSSHFLKRPLSASHVEISEQSRMPLLHLALSDRAAPSLEACVVPGGASLAPQSWACALQLPALRLPWLILSPVPGRHFCGLFPLVSQGLEEGWWGPLGRAHRSPTLGAFCKPVRRELEPSPEQAAPVPPLCARIGRLSPADLPASGDMWKVRDKNGFCRGRGSALVQKGRKYLCGIFSPALHPKNTETLCL